MKSVTLTLLMFLPLIAYAKHLHPEKYYQNQWCAQHNGQAEVILPDRTRCDCLTDTHAIEFDFGPKWAEAIGQSLYYGLQTGKRPGIVLILEQESDYKYWIRLNTTINHYGLTNQVSIFKP
jgi:hypothetical protein